MPTIQDLKKHLEDLGVPMLVRAQLGGELIPLVQAMGSEDAAAFVAGEWDGKKAALVATPTRLILARGGLWGNKVEVFPYNQIRSLEYSSGMTGGMVEINGNALKKVRADTVQPFVHKVNDLRTPRPPATPAAPQETPLSLADEVAKLQALRDNGALSDAEFAAAKGRLLGL